MSIALHNISELGDVAQRYLDLPLGVSAVVIGNPSQWESLARSENDFWLTTPAGLDNSNAAMYTTDFCDLTPLGLPTIFEEDEDVCPEEDISPITLIVTSPSVDSHPKILPLIPNDYTGLHCTLTRKPRVAKRKAKPSNEPFAVFVDNPCTPLPNRVKESFTVFADINITAKRVRPPEKSKKVFIPGGGKENLS